MTVSLLKDILTEIDGGCTATDALAGLCVAGVAKVRECSRFRHAVDSIRDPEPNVDVVGTEPVLVSLRNRVGIPQTINVTVGSHDPEGGHIHGLLKLLLVRSCTFVGINDPLVVDMPGDTEITGKPDLGNIPNSGVEVLGCPVSIDIGEVV